MSELMERAVPPYTGTGDWGAVLRDAGAARRRARLRPALAFAVVVAALVVAWQAAAPLLDDRPRARRRRRRPRAAPGLRGLDAEAARRPPRPASGASCAAPTRCGSTRPRARASARRSAASCSGTSLNTTDHGREIYSSLGTGYRDALRSGSAKVVGETESVYWIRISPGHDVAVSRDTYRPVSLRVGDMPETRILTYETLREMPSAPAPQLPPQPRTGGGRISLAEAERVLGRAPLWPGTGRPVVRRLGDGRGRAPRAATS